MGERLTRILPKVATSTSLLGSFTCRKFTTWDRRLYFPSEGRCAEEFFARKFRRLRPGLNPRTWVPKASTLTSRPPEPLTFILFFIINTSYSCVICCKFFLYENCTRIIKVFVDWWLNFKIVLKIYSIKCAKDFKYFYITYMLSSLFFGPCIFNNEDKK